MENTTNVIKSACILANNPLNISTANKSTPNLQSQLGKRPPEYSYSATCHSRLLQFFVQPILPLMEEEKKYGKNI